MKYYLVMAMLILASISFAWSFPAAPFRSNITIVNPYGTVLTNFPLIIQKNLSSYSNGCTNIILTNQSDNEILNYEIENNSCGVIWTKIPSFVTAQNQSIYAYHNFTSPVDNSTIYPVWDSNYVYVFHASEDQAIQYNSRPNLNGSALVDCVHDTAGIFGSGITCAGNNTATGASGIIINNGWSNSYFNTQNLTIEIWFNITDFGSGRTLIGKTTGSELAINLGQGGAGNIRVYSTATGGFDNIGGYATGVVANATQYLVVTVSNESGLMRTKIYLNGKFLQQLNSTGSLDLTTATLTIGSAGSGGLPGFKGKIDEIRLSNVARSESYIKAVYNLSLAIFGAEDSTSYFAVNINDPTNISYIDSSIILNFTSNVNSNCSRQLDNSSFIGLGEIYNTTSSYSIVTVNNLGPHNITVRCNFVNSTVNMTANATVFFSSATHKIISSSYEPNLLQGQSTSYTISILYGSFVSSISGSVVINGTVYSGSVNILNSSYMTISKTTTAPFIYGLADTISHYWNLTLVLPNGSISYDVSPYENQTVSSFQLISCGGVSNTTTLNFSVFDEQTMSPLFTDFKGSFDVKQSPGSAAIHFNFSFINKSSNAFCIYPTTATLYVDALISYNATTTNSTVYPIRYYFLSNAIITNVSNNISLYGLDNNSGFDLVPITVKSAAGQSKAGAFVSVRKFYPAENMYRLVAMGLTDVQGVARVFMQVPNYYYSFVITEGSTVVATTSKQLMIASGTTVTVPTTLQNYYIYHNSVFASCTSNSTSMIVSCSYTDTSGLAAIYNLTVIQRGALLDTPLCSKISTSASSTLICDVAGIVNGSYPWFFTAYYDNPSSITSGSLDIGLTARYGNTGIFLALIIFVTLALIGVFAPEAVILFGLGALILVSILQLVALQVSVIAALFVAMLIYIVKKKGRYQ